MRKPKLVQDFRLTIPNLLTISRIPIGPGCLFLLATDRIKDFGYSSFEIANTVLGLYAFAVVTDLLDGLIAKIFPSQSSGWGKRWDPWADAILTICVLVSILAYKEWNGYELAVLFFIVGRETWRFWPFAEHDDGTDDEPIPKYEFERTRQAVCFIACGLVLARSTWIEIQWNEHLPLVLWSTLGSLGATGALAVTFAAHIGSERWREHWCEKKERLKNARKRQRRKRNTRNTSVRWSEGMTRK